MKVELAKLKPNPFRDFAVDPIDEENVKALIQSIKDDGFWGGVVCRKTKNGIEIAAGHTRVKAAQAKECGIETADLFVGNFTDDQMIRIYARENSTQRGNSTTAVAGSVISTIRFLAKEILTGEDSTWRILQIEQARSRLVAGEGIGRDLLERFLEGIPRINSYIIKEQLATLKASGDYQRVIAEVSAEIESETGISESTREQSRKAAAHVASQKPEFDFAGVAPYLQNENQMRAFREKVTAPEIKEILPVAKQAELAKHLTQKAKEDAKTDKTLEFGARYIRENIGALVRDFKDQGRKISREEKAARERADIQAKFDRLCEDFARHGRGLMETGSELIEFIDAHSDTGFRMPEAMKSAIRNAHNVLNKLTQSL